jgi:hypothetical protein
MLELAVAVVVVILVVDMVVYVLVELVDVEVSFWRKVADEKDKMATKESTLKIFLSIIYLGLSKI